ncbi:DUF998 domain-containing protein [Alkalibacterium pelagium]|jgi:hypothetical membrane protein|uniref:DUF998 domain-containing protein n=1 Tax=Alkalibacterium pelagium TaxID=426702 RepID=A0A1H7FCY0_9LACT|nr:DUF998 domain-containing protein [Alkalibacterium pelagium]GEN49398.1 hypothetical protein APE02nite_00630 [Alkalibacterium pelagium]SEK23839.1 Protein of unknown function [Alkalibacterium pelagium]
MKKTMINYLGLLGPVSLLSYAAAVIFSPLAYPGYDWMSQAVSDLSSTQSPSLGLWNQLSSLYGIAGVVNVTVVSLYVQDKLHRSQRIGIYIFSVMLWFSYIGYSMFPLTTETNGLSIQNMIHVFVVTGTIVVLSLVSLTTILTADLMNKCLTTLSMTALICLLFMLTGAAGTALAPLEWFGVFERFSVFSVVVFNAVLGLLLYKGTLPHW